MVIEESKSLSLVSIIQGVLALVPFSNRSLQRRHLAQHSRFLAPQSSKLVVGSMPYNHLLMLS